MSYEFRPIGPITPVRPSERVPMVIEGHDPERCSICKGTGSGDTGYRPHTLDSKCWCVPRRPGRVTCYMLAWFPNDGLAKCVYL